MARTRRRGTRVWPGSSKVSGTAFDASIPTTGTKRLQLPLKTAAGVGATATVTGVVVTLSANTVTGRGGSLVAVTGVTLTCSAGTPGATGGATCAVTGATVSVSAVTPTAVGGSTASVAGATVNVSAATPAATGAASATVAGVSVTVSAGSPAATGEATAAVTGATVGCTAATPGAAGGATCSVTGVTTSLLAATPGATGGALASVTGGTVTLSAATPGVYIFTAATVTGATVNVSAATPTATGGAVATVTGVVVTLSAATPVAVVSLVASVSAKTSQIVSTTVATPVVLASVLAAIGGRGILPDVPLVAGSVSINIIDATETYSPSTGPNLARELYEARVGASSLVDPNNPPKATTTILTMAGATAITVDTTAGLKVGRTISCSFGETAYYSGNMFQAVILSLSPTSITLSEPVPVNLAIGTVFGFKGTAPDWYNQTLPELVKQRQSFAAMANADAGALVDHLNLNWWTALPTVDRPVDDLVTGFMMLDTTLGIPIWWDGAQWVDADGNPA